MKLASWLNLLARACPTLLALIAAWSLCQRLPADEPKPDPSATDLTEEKLDHPPERKTKYERIADPRMMELYDVKLVDQKYIATIHIILPKSNGDPYSQENPDPNFGRDSFFLSPDGKHKEVAALQVVYDRPLLSRARTRQGRPFTAAEASLGGTWQRMLTQIPAERRPSKELQEFFGSEEVQRFVFFEVPRSGSGPFSRFGPETIGSGPNRVSFRSLHVLAATPEQAQQRATALLTILDQGFSRPTQLALFKVRNDVCREYRDSQEKLAVAEKEQQAVSTELKQFAEFPADTLAGLRVQLFQWEAELAGLKAKVETCDKLLKEGGTEGRLKQIEEARLAAQIELAGCEARRAKSADLITKVHRRNDLAAKQDAATQRQNEAWQVRRSIAGSIQAIDDEIAAFGPVHLVEDTVVIQPVEWTKNN